MHITRCEFRPACRTLAGIICSLVAPSEIPAWCTAVKTRQTIHLPVLLSPKAVPCQQLNLVLPQTSPAVSTHPAENWLEFWSPAWWRRPDR